MRNYSWVVIFDPIKKRVKPRYFKSCRDLLTKSVTFQLQTVHKQSFCKDKVTGNQKTAVSVKFNFHSTCEKKQKTMFLSKAMQIPINIKNPAGSVQMTILYILTNKLQFHQQFDQIKRMVRKINGTVSSSICFEGTNKAMQTYHLQCFRPVRFVEGIDYADNAELWHQTTHFSVIL